MSKNFMIYVVDDDPMIRDTLDSILSDDFSLEMFDSAESCLERIASALPRMILLDISLPGMDGYEMCRRLRKR